ncbi:hypothetical protein DFJ77DRAFT_471072 [Powellomyces hirtus]|nr:hypothetical protein DFJ77DRAFT_471072 [Powellomyces hirtus]
MVERPLCMREAVGSMPTFSKIFLLFFTAMSYQLSPLLSLPPVPSRLASPTPLVNIYFGGSAVCQRQRSAYFLIHVV